MREAAPAHEFMNPASLEFALRVGFGAQLLRDHAHGVEIVDGRDARLAADGDQRVDIIRGGDRADPALRIRMIYERLRELEREEEPERRVGAALGDARRTALDARAIPGSGALLDAGSIYGGVQRRP